MKTTSGMDNVSFWKEPEYPLLKPIAFSNSCDEDPYLTQGLWNLA